MYMQKPDSELLDTLDYFATITEDGLWQVLAKSVFPW